MKPKFEVEDGVAYFDNAVTTPIRQSVLEAMLPFLQEKFANPDEPYEPSRQAAEALSDFRAQIAEMVEAKPENVWFTSGGTEANNWVMQQTHKRPVAAEIEHRSVSQFIDTPLRVDKQGQVDLDHLQEVISESAIVSVQHANQETGIIQDIPAVAEVCRTAGVPLHVDAAMSFGVMPVELVDLGANFLTISSHKAWGPVGAGALVSDGTYEIFPMLRGGSQEFGMRAGPVNMPAVAGFAAAAEHLRTSVLQWQTTENLRNHIETELGDILEITAIGSEVDRLPNMACLTFPGCDAAFVVAEMERRSGACVGVGSTDEPGTSSRVLKAMGVDRMRRESSIRLRFPPWFTTQDADHIIVGVSSALREEQSRPLV